MDEETDDEDDGEEVNREKERERKRRRNEADDEEVRRKREEDSEKSTARVLFMLFAALNNEGMAMAMDTEEASDTEELSRVMYGLDAVAASVRSQCAHAAALARVPPRPLDGIIECVYHTAGSGAVWSRRKGVLQRERETEILAATHRVLGNVIGHVIDVLLARFHADPKMRERRSASRTAAAAARLVALRLYRQLDDATRAMCDRGAPHVLGEEPRLRPDLVDAKQRALWPSNARLLMPANVPVTAAHRDAAPLPRAEDYIASVGARVARRIAVMVCEFERVALFNLNARLPENRDRAAMYRTVTPRQWLLCSLLGRVDRSCAGFARLCIADAMDDALAAYYRDVVERLGEMDAETMARELDKAGRVRRDVEGASIYAPDVTVFGPFGFTERDEPRADPAYRELLRDGNYVRVLPQAERWADLPHLPLPDRRLLDRLVGSFMSTLFACHGMASVACAVLAAWKDYPETQEGRAHADRALRRAAEQGSGREPKEAGGPWGGMRSAHGPATLARAAGTSAGADVEAYVRQAVARQPFVERLARIGSALSNGTVAETAFTINDERDVEAVHDATVMCYRDPADIRRKLSAAGRSDPATFWRDVTETMRGFVMGYLLSCVVRVARDVVTVRWTRELSEVKSLAGIPWKLVRLDAAAGGTSVVAPRT
jgi:hypothetical protein